PPLVVVRIVVAGREHVGAQHDAPLHLFAKPFRTRPCVERYKIHRVVAAISTTGPVTVTDSVVSGQVAGGLGGGQHVVGTDTILRVRQRYITDFGARFLERAHAHLDQTADPVVQPVGKILPWKSDSKTLDATSQRSGVVRHLYGSTGGILRILPRHGIEHQGDIRNRLAHRADRVQGGCVGDEAVSAHASVGRLEAHDAAEGAGLAYRASGVGAECRVAEIGGYRGG